MNTIKDIKELGKHLFSIYTSKEEIGVDATCGWGRDTLWLAQRCKKIYSFDVQDKAISHTKKMLEVRGKKNGEVYKDSFENMAKYPVTGASIVMFNLGYLPKGDKNLTTTKESTLKGVKEALNLIRVGGAVCIIMYWGHEEGKEERQGLLDFAKSLDKGEYHCLHTSMINQIECPPEILIIEKTKEIRKND